MEETRGNAIARIPKMISTIAKTSEVPDALLESIFQYGHRSFLIWRVDSDSRHGSTYAQRNILRRRKQVMQTGAERKLSITTVAGWHCPVFKLLCS